MKVAHRWKLTTWEAKLLEAKHFLIPESLMPVSLFDLIDWYGTFISVQVQSMFPKVGKDLLGEFRDIPSPFINLVLGFAMRLRLFVLLLGCTR